MNYLYKDYINILKIILIIINIRNNKAKNKRSVRKTNNKMIK